MIQTKSSLCEKFVQIVSIPFLLILLFGFVLAYFNSPDVSGNVVHTMLEGGYALKKILLFACFALCVIRKKVPIVSFVVVAAATVIMLITYLASPVQFVLFQDIYLDFFCGIVCFLLIAGGVVSVERLMKIAVIVGRILLLLCALTMLTIPNFSYFIAKNYMFFSNALAVPVGVLFYNSYKKKGWLDYFLALAGWLLVLLYGSRGTMLTLLVLAVLVMCAKAKRRHELTALLVISIVLLGGLIVVFVDGAFFIDSRTLQMILSNEFFTSSTRFDIWGYVIGKSLEDGLIGRGFCTDRMYLLEINGTDSQVYAHNFFVELLADFGILGVLGGIALVVLLAVFFYRCKEAETKGAVLMFFCTSFLPLMISRTFLAEPGFFMMLAIAVRWFLLQKDAKAKLKTVEEGKNE